MRRRGRVDAVHAAVVDCFRLAGATVVSLADQGDGLPDLLVGMNGCTLLVEVKDGRKPPSAQRLTADQVLFHAAWRGTPIRIVRSVDEALQAVQQIRGRAAAEGTQT